MISFGVVIMSNDVIYCSVLSFAAKLTKIEDVLYLGTTRRREHNTLLNKNQAKIVKALAGYLCPKVHPGFARQLSLKQGWF